MREYVGRMTVDWMREIVFDDHADSRNDFASALPDEVTAAVQALSDVYGAFQDVVARFPSGERSATVFGFLHVANNSLVGALNLLMSGYLVPAGNLMRHFAEASAMALLCSEQTNGTLESYRTHGMKYPFHHSIDRVSKKKVMQALGIERDEWESFKKSAKFYDLHSHASDMAVAANIIFDNPGMVVMGGQFDPGKVEHYRLESAQITFASVTLLGLMSIVERHLMAAQGNPDS